MAIDCHLSATKKSGMLKAKVEGFDAWSFFIAHKDAQRSVLLYSGGDSPRARYHILGLKPAGWFASKRGQLEIGQGEKIKKTKSEDLRGFTLIALCNVIYKFISTINFKSLKTLLPNLISLETTTFVEDR